MTRTKNTTQTITVATSDLRRIVDLVKPCTNDDAFFTSYVRLFTADGNLYATATDRYAMIVAKGPGVGGDFEAVVHRSALQRILVTFKSSRKFAAEINLTAEPAGPGTGPHAEGLLIASSTSINLEGLAEGTLSFSTLPPAKYPDALSIIRKCIAAGPVNRPVMATAQYLAKVPAGESAHLVGGDEPFTPVGFISRGWAYVFMPHRTATGEDSGNAIADTWTKVLPEAPAKKAAA